MNQPATTSQTPRTDAPARIRTYFLECPSCGSAVGVFTDWEKLLPNRGTKTKCCNRFPATRKINVGTSEHECDSRCTNATGSNCDCCCNGRNHGKHAKAA